MDAGITVQIITAATALVAVIVGPIVSLKIMRRETSTSLEIARAQITAEVVANNRQQWINTFRDTLSEYLSKLGTASLASRVGLLTPEQGYRANARVSFLYFKLSLLINPTEGDHASLMGLVSQIHEAFDMASHKTASADSLRPVQALIPQIVALMQKILKREWERVKAVQ